MKNLIESIKNMYQPQAEATMMKDDGKMVHNCAKHVEHRQWGQGATMAEEHADPDRYGNIAWYDIEFAHGVEKGVPISELRVLQAESHGHPTKKAKKMAEAEDLSMDKKNGKVKAEVEDDDENEMEDDEKMPMKGKKKVAETIEFSMTAEEFDQLDEISKATLASYIPKAAKSSRLMGQIGTDFENRADRSRKPGMKQAATELGQKYKQDARKREGMIGRAANRLAMEDFDSSTVDETIIHADRSYELDEAQKTGNYDAHFKAHMKKHGVKHPGELDTPEKKKAFFNAVDASYKAKNEEVFVEAYMTSDIEDVMTAHKKAGNRISNETSGKRDGKPHHSFVVTTPEGKRTRHIYHGTTKKLESMSPAARSKESKDQGLDEDNKYQIDELSKTTLGSYIKKAHGSAADSAEDAGLAQQWKAKGAKYKTPSTDHLINKAVTVQAKREKGIGRATAKLTKEDLDNFTIDQLEELLVSEDFDQLDELSKATLASYVNKAHRSGVVNSKKSGLWGYSGSDRSENPRDEGRYEKARDTAAKREIGVSSAVKRLTK